MLKISVLRLAVMALVVFLSTKSYAASFFDKIQKLTCTHVSEKQSISRAANTPPDWTL